MNESRHPAADDKSDDPFVAYYEAESVSEAAFRRSASIMDDMLRLRAGLGLDADRLVVADIGCNAGTQSTVWAQQGHAVHGIDINEPLVDIARRRNRETGLDIDFRVGTATDLPWASASMDICLLPELLEHVPEWEAVLDEACRLLRPGGMLYLSTSNRLCPVQEEFDLPLYSWYPARVKRRCVQLALTTHREWVAHAEYPAVNWFTPQQLAVALQRRGFTAYDRFDIINADGRPYWQRAMLRLVRAIGPLRWLGHVATPYVLLIAVRN